MTCLWCGLRSPTHQCPECQGDVCDRCTPSGGPCYRCLAKGTWVKETQEDEVEYWRARHELEVKLEPASHYDGAHSLRPVNAGAAMGYALAQTPMIVAASDQFLLDNGKVVILSISSREYTAMRDLGLTCSLSPMNCALMVPAMYSTLGRKA